MEFDSQKMLNLYIYDHLVKRNMHITAESFAKEADLHPESFVVPPVEGFLSDWWCLFWDVYCARLNHGAATQASSSQTTQNAGGMLQTVHPALPVSRPPDVNFAMQMPDFTNLLRSVCPTTMQKPDIGILLQNSTSVMLSTIPRLDMRDLLQNSFSMMPPTEFNPVTSITDINMMELRTKTKLIAARMSEKICPRPPASDVYSNLNLTKVNQLAPVLPSSSSLSALRSCSQPQKKNNKKRKFSVTIDDNISTGFRGSTSVELILPTSAKRAVQNSIDLADTGSSTSSNSACPNSSS